MAVQILEDVFRSASLNKLTLLDLSWNFLRFVPPNFACPLPSLTHLYFRNNFLDTLNLNASCLQKLQVRPFLSSSIVGMNPFG